MGREVTCPVTVDGETRTARVQLETTEIIIHGRPRLKVPFVAMKQLAAAAGALTFRAAPGAVRIAVGPKAAEWLAAIRTPRPRLDKLGVKPGMRVAAVRLDDGAFLGEVAAGTGSAVRRRLAGPVDLVFLGAEDEADLAPLARARAAIAPDGAAWVIWPKGRKEFGESHVRRAALAAGLVDVKVVAFDGRLSALKLVIPVAQRGGRKK
jgi:hypothetical protein